MSRWRVLAVVAVFVAAGVVWTDAPRAARAQGAVWTLAGSTQSQEVAPPSRCFSTELSVSNIAASFITNLSSQCGERGIHLARHRWGEMPATLTAGQTHRFTISADVSGSEAELWLVTTRLSVLGGEEIVTAKAGDTFIRNNRVVDWTVPDTAPGGDLVLVVRADTNGRGWVETRFRYTMPGAAPAAAPASMALAPAGSAALPYDPVFRPEPAITLMGPTAAAPGLEVTYTILVRNDGNGLMNGVTVTLSLRFAGEIAGGTRLVAARGGYHCAMSENEPAVTCTGGSISPGSGAVLEITVKAPENANVITATAAVRCTEREQPVAAAPVETAIG